MQIDKPRLLVGLGLALSLGAQAAPAPWHLWRSLVDGREHCAQTSPGPGWVYARGPYRDLRCSEPLDAERTPPRNLPRFEPDQTSAPPAGRR